MSDVFRDDLAKELIDTDFEERECSRCGRTVGRDEPVDVLFDDEDQIKAIRCSRKECTFRFPTRQLVRVYCNYRHGDLVVIEAIPRDTSNPEEPSGEKITYEDLEVTTDE